MRGAQSPSVESRPDVDDADDAEDIGDTAVSHSSMVLIARPMLPTWQCEAQDSAAVKVRVVSDRA